MATTTVQLLNASPAEVVTYSTEHHSGQPAHASLQFDGPDRGAILRAGPHAPINSMEFHNGYTIEAFIKLPEPFEGDHAWMGILSWEGRSGDAGKPPAGRPTSAPAATPPGAGLTSKAAPHRV
ncbi:hypothetical protein [Micromonospora chokoriensis]